MRRREEIENAAHQKYPYVGGIKGMICENSIPIFIQGAEWADKTMIDKACEWLDRYLHLFVMKGHINHSALEQELRKAMEE